MSLKRQKLDTTTLTFPATITKNCFFHGSITFVSLFLYQNWWGWKADFWNIRLAWKEWKLKTKLKVECKLLWWLKPSFYPEPSQKASKKAHLCNHQQVDLVSTLRKLFEQVDVGFVFLTSISKGAQIETKYSVWGHFLWVCWLHEERHTCTSEA